MKHTLTILTLLLFTTINAQIAIEKGYYINNNDQRIEGFIKNADWGVSPDSFVFYSSKDADGKTISINNAKSFGLYDITKYERHLVNIDRSSDNLNDLGRDRNPDMKIETLFLKVIIEGDLNLYSHTILTGTKFYVQKKGELIHPLIYKRYLSYDNKIKENNYFQQQLVSDFSCEGLSFNTSNLRYRKNDILKYVEKYNTCKGGTSTKIEKREKANFFNFYLLGGVNYNSFKIENAGNRNFDFGATANPVFGFELEFLLPNNNNKWAAFIDGRYTSFSGDGTSSFSSALTDEIFTQEVEADLSLFDVSLGGRYYFYLNPKTKIYLSASYSLEFVSDIDVTYTSSQDFVATNGQGSFGVSAGVSWSNFRGEIRYNTPKDHINSQSEYSSLMLTLSYKVLKF